VVRVSWFVLKTKVHCFSRFGLKTGGDGFSWFHLKTGGGGFPGLGLKIGSYSLVILASKSLRQFLDLCLKIKRATVCWLHNKIDGRMKTTRGTHRDLATCFVWKKVGLGFPICLKIGGGVTSGGAYDTITEVGSSRRRTGRCDEQRRNLLSFAILYILCHKDILVF
jgi:hypothetical protein